MKKEKREITSLLKVGSIYELKREAMFQDKIFGWKIFPPNSYFMLLDFNLHKNFSDNKPIITMTFLNPDGRISIRTDFDKNIYLYLQLKQQ